MNNNHDIKQASERSEDDSRPKGVNSGSISSPLNRRIRLQCSSNLTHLNCMEASIDCQWDNNFTPQWFITLQWIGQPTKREIVEAHARHFKNILLKALMGIRKAGSIPSMENRPRMIFFHELADIGNRNLVYHTHLHLGNLPPEQNNEECLIELLLNHVLPKVNNLSKTHTDNNRGIDIKRWNRDRHGHYNLKDYRKYKGHYQLEGPLDVYNSDLIWD